MKSHWIKPLIVLVFLAALSACTRAPNRSEKPKYLATYPSQFIVGDTYILKDNEKIEGNVVGIGTSLVIGEKATITGDISLIGSTLEIAGQIDGNLNILAGTTTIKDTAVIIGNINQLFQTTVIKPNAQVSGKINTFSFPDAANGQMGSALAGFLKWFRPAKLIGFAAFRLIGLMVLSLIGATIFRNSTNKVASAIQSNSPAAWGAGLLALIASPIIVGILIITICLSPVGILLLLAIIISILWGWAALGSIAGLKITFWLNLEWRTEPATLLGALILGLFSILISLIPCLGFLINLMITATGLGGVILSKFGRTH